MRFLPDATSGYLAVPFVVMIFVGFLRVAAALRPAGRGAAIGARADEDRVAA